MKRCLTEEVKEIQVIKILMIKGEVKVEELRQKEIQESNSLNRSMLLNKERYQLNKN